ncbi:hypothetical protein LLY24_16340 [Halomonas sp. wenzhen-202101]|uniref:Uncharacterized protein n=1 Tax=Halomonas dongshanensis TaxID=2890835 RepID=A0ABT2EH31_9GAMM|nr:hypothetical protein [Halomonas dongshanensis]MCS2610886.1 hypothetical protein [Halomonas dongshanensis]
MIAAVADRLREEWSPEQISVSRRLVRLLEQVPFGPPPLIGLSPASPGNHSSHGTKASDALTFKMEHSSGLIDKRANFCLFTFHICRDQTAA